MKLGINENSFSSYTKESAYWAGFLAADGNLRINNSGSKCVRVYLSKTDYNHLLKFKKFLSSGHLVSISEKYDRCSFEFANSVIYSDLEKYYLLTPRKSLVLEYPNIPAEVESHFIRGYMDGDGTICESFSNKRSLTSSLCVAFIGAPKFMVSLREVVLTAIDKQNILALSVRPNGINTWLHLNTRDAIKFLNWVYNGSEENTRLDRKFNIYKRIVIDGVRKSRSKEQRDMDNGIVHP